MIKVKQPYEGAERQEDITTFQLEVTIRKRELTWDKEEITTESTNYNPEHLPLFEDLDISVKERMNGNLDDHIDSIEDPEKHIKRGTSSQGPLLAPSKNLNDVP